MVPEYPLFAPISLQMRSELHPHFLNLTAGISEFTFSNIFLFRHGYDYHLSRFAEGKYIITGTKHGKKFFSCPWGLPPKEILLELFSKHDYLKNLNEQQVEQERAFLESLGFEIREDRDNWDYVYSAQEMAELEGKKFHKKRNHVHAFFNEYPEGFDGRVMTNSAQDTDQALSVLEIWQSYREDRADYQPSKEAIEFRQELGLSGYLWTLKGQPLAYAQGEAVQGGKTFVIHFEKADGAVKGAYQAVFQHWSQELKNHHELINREQDLGEPGLRQAKETYRPVVFVHKFQVWPTT